MNKGIHLIWFALSTVIVQFSVSHGQNPSELALIKRPIFQNPLTYKLTRSATNDFWGKDFMSPPRIGVGDLSLQTGGKFGIHDSHQNGLDMDFRYVRNDAQDHSLNIASDQRYYDTAATAYLMNLFAFSTSASVQVILYDSVNAHLVGGPLLHWPGHSDHFHIRINDPDGTGN